MSTLKLKETDNETVFKWVIVGVGSECNFKMHMILISKFITVENMTNDKEYLGYLERTMLKRIMPVV